MSGEDLSEETLARAMEEIRALDKPVRLRPTHWGFPCDERIEFGDPVVWRDGKLYRA